MNLLLIDTCGSTGSIAIADPLASPAIRAAATLPGRAASERLIPEIQRLLAGHGATLQWLSAIAVIHGPGSFTGVRVGVSATKGLCEALGLPAIAISRLAVLASLAPQPSTAVSGASPVYSLLDAGRSEFYLGDYLHGLCRAETLVTRGQLLSVLTSAGHNPTTIACEPTIAQMLPRLTHLVHEPAAADALPLALSRLAQSSFDDLANLDANYVRRTDAEIFAKPKSPSEPAAL